MPTYRPEFEAALRLFARVSEAVARRGHPRPILVGGAAVEFYTASAINTGDFDLCSTAQDVIEKEFRAHGFIRPSGSGKATRGWIHPDLALGFEVVGDMPLDGAVTRDQVSLVENFEPRRCLRHHRGGGFDRRPHGPICLGHRAGHAGAGPTSAQPSP